MVDITGKAFSKRTAKAQGMIYLQPETLALIEKDQIGKGNVLQVAKLGGIQAAKKTADLILLAHPINLSHIDVKAFIEKQGIRIEATARITERTGVEMEALTAVSAALLNIYDMCKAVDDKMMISEIKLIQKTKNETL